MNLSISLPLFVFCTAVIAVAGTLLTRTADRLADRTGLGEAVMGAAFLGMVTSLGGAVVSVTAAADGMADLAVSNAIGGIAVQTLFLVVADAMYRKANLEHAAASSEGLIQASWLLVMLATTLFATSAMAITIWQLHPVSLLLPLGYLGSLLMARREREHPMWFPRNTKDLQKDEPEEERGGQEMVRLWIRFVGLGVVMVVAGYFLERSGVAAAEQLGITQSILGALLTSTATSLPELVTTLAAVRAGALGLAIGGIVGGNTFDILFLSLSDAAYREGSLYHAAPETSYLLSWSLVITGILLLGLLKRQRDATARVGLDGIGITLAYLLGVVGILTGFGQSI